MPLTSVTLENGTYTVSSDDGGHQFFSHPQMVVDYLAIAHPGEEVLWNVQHTAGQAYATALISDFLTEKQKTKTT